MLRLFHILSLSWRGDEYDLGDSEISVQIMRLAEMARMAL